MHAKNFIISLITGAVVAVLFGITAINFFYRSEIATGTQIANDIAKLKGIFDTINAQCTILSFDAQQNPINFLNVKSFEGSEVGPMNLVHPQGWLGPYLGDNPTIQGKEYMIVKTNNGYFITPPNGITLPNNKKIGTDVVLDMHADVQNLIDNKTLVFQGKPLAAALMLGAAFEGKYADAWRMQQ